MNLKIQELEIKINLMNESDLKGDLSDKEFEQLKVYKRDLEKEKQKFSPKQVIVIRKDLNMPAGKLAAQVSHASLGVITNLMHKEIENYKSCLKIELDNKNKHSKALEEWITGRFTKVILYVKSEEALLKIYNKAQLNKLPCCLIEDAGFTVFDKPTKTCLGIGPVLPKYLAGITDKLQVFKG